jgi:hypothetical protein
LPFVLGCVGITYSYTPTTQNIGMAKSSRCSFDLLTMRPSRAYLELGVLEPTDGAGASATEFKEAVGDQVCRVGGDAVLTEVNGFGHYVRGTVIKYDDALAREKASSVVLSPPPPGMAAAIAFGPVDVRSAPFEIAPVMMVVQSGQRLWVVPSPTNGWRAATLSDGRSGYVQDAHIKMEASP